jgi:hypothetical protein
LDEECDGIVLFERLERRMPTDISDREWRDWIFLFSGEVKRYSAGGENSQIRGRSEEFCDHGPCAGEVLAIIDEQQNPPLPEVLLHCID